MLVDGQSLACGPVRVECVSLPMYRSRFSGEYAYVSTLLGKLVKTKREEPAFTYTEATAPLKKIVAYEDVLFGFEGCLIVVYNCGLKLLAFYTGPFAIVDIVVLYVGYDCGIIVEYDITGITADAKHRTGCSSITPLPAVSRSESSLQLKSLPKLRDRCVF